MVKAFLSIFAFGAIIVLSGCDLSGHITPEEEPITVPVEPVAEVKTADEALPEAVAAKRDQILETLELNSVWRLARFADQEEDFRSNYGALSHYDHWYILRRAGISPIEKTKQVLEQPYGVKDFGAERFYIWPYFATRAPEELDMSRLSFTERTVLVDLIGEDGIARLEAGEPYPGWRVAIRQDGSWAYLLQDN